MPFLVLQYNDFGGLFLCRKPEGRHAAMMGD